RQYPQIALELHSSEQIIDLLEQRTDIAIRIGPLRDSTLHARALGSSRLRLLASPAYLAARGRPVTVADLDRHSLLGFTRPDSLNDWPVRDADGDLLHIRPALAASSGETLRQLALAGEGIVCLSDFMTGADRQASTLLPVLAGITLDMRQPIHAVYYRNTQLAARIACFLDFVGRRIGADSQWLIRADDAR
ncbi:MAG: LysR substrate-binding domain-containing protein, partial [Microvirgula sp.]